MSAIESRNNPIYLHLLNSHLDLTSAQLSKRLEISRQTVRREISSLLREGFVTALPFTESYTVTKRHGGKGIEMHVSVKYRAVEKF